MLNGYSPVTPYRPLQPGIYNQDGRRMGPGRAHRRPQPFQPQPPMGRTPYPMPYPRPYPYPTPYPYRQGVVGQVWHGFTGRLQELTQIALHPFNPYARMMPYHNPYVPYTTAEKVGRWIVNGALLGGAVLLGSAVLGGGGLGLGGGAAVGLG